MKIEELIEALEKQIPKKYIYILMDQNIVLIVTMI